MLTNRRPKFFFFKLDPAARMCLEVKAKHQLVVPVLNDAISKSWCGNKRRTMPNIAAHSSVEVI